MSRWWSEIKAKFAVLHAQDFLGVEDYDKLAETVMKAHCNGILNACVLNDYIPQERISEALEAFKKRGLRMVIMVVSFMGTAAAKSLGIPLPDYYVAEDIEGRKAEWPNPLTGELAHMMWCPVRPERRSKLVEMCKRLAELGVDGIMLDYIRYGGSQFCYCGYCREKMAEEGISLEGLTLQDTVNPRNPIRRKITLWRSQNITSIVKEITSEVKRVNPDVAVGAYTVNHSYPESNLFALGQDFEEFSKILDFIMPGSYYSELWGSTWPGVVAEYMKSLSKKAKIWIGLASYRLRTAQMLKLNIYEAFSHGADGVIEFGGSPEGVKSHNRPHHWKALSEAYQFIEEIESLLSLERVKPFVAPYSIKTVKTRGIEEGLPYTDNYREVLQTFMGIGVPVAAGDPWEAHSGIILTGLEALTEKEALEIPGIVEERGLGLLAFYQSGLYILTEKGGVKERNVLNEVLGDEYGSPPSISPKLKALDPNHPILQSIKMKMEEPIVRSLTLANIKPSTSKVLVTSETPSLPLITVNTPGKGRTVHFAWPLTEDKNYLKEPFRRLYRASTEWAVPKPYAYIKSEHSLDLTVRKEGKTIFMLVTNIMKGPTLYNPRPVRDVKIYLNVPYRDVESAETCREAEVKFEPSGEGTILSLSVIDDAEGIIVKLK